VQTIVSLWYVLMVMQDIDAKLTMSLVISWTYVLGNICSILTESDGSRNATYWYG